MSRSARRRRDLPNAGMRAAMARKLAGSMPGGEKHVGVRPHHRPAHCIRRIVVVDRHRSNSQRRVGAKFPADAHNHTWTSCAVSDRLCPGIYCARRNDADIRSRRSRRRRDRSSPLSSLHYLSACRRFSIGEGGCQASDPARRHRDGQDGAAPSRH
jgi:hypothetical protein